MKKILLLTILSVSAWSTLTNLTNSAIDSNTGLEWQDDSSLEQRDPNYSIYIPLDYGWNSSINYCENLNLAGHSDWRLPNIRELSSIIDYTIGNGSSSFNYGTGSKNILDNNGQYTIKSRWIWSSTTVDGNNTSVWTMNYFTHEFKIQEKSSKMTRRCVRDSK